MKYLYLICICTLLMSHVSFAQKVAIPQPTYDSTLNRQERLPANRPKAETADTGKRFFYKLIPSNVKLQFAGNIGLFSTGIGYQSPNKRWQVDALYGFVPRRYSGTQPIHSLTLKGKYATLTRNYRNNEFKVQWLQMGLWTNYALNEDFFFKLPRYYEPNYYLIRPGFNIGGFLGSELRYKNWGFYYEVGTTDKYIIHYLKNFPSVRFNHIVSAGLGLVYHLKR